MRGTVWDVIGPNLTLLVISLAAFAAVIYALFLIGSRASVRWQGWLRYGVFLGPALLLLLVGLIYPALRTIWMSLMDKRSENFIGFDNYIWAFTIPEIQIVLRNTMLYDRPHEECCGRQILNLHADGYLLCGSERYLGVHL